MEAWISQSRHGHTPSTGRQKLVKAISGRTTNRVVQEGVNVYIDYVEQCMSKCTTLSWELTASLSQGKKVDDYDQKECLLEAAVLVAQVLRSGSWQQSLDGLAQQLMMHIHVPKYQQDDSGNIHTQHHIAFSCIGWLSMLFTPHPELFGDTLRKASSTKSLLTPILSPTLLSDHIKRPLGSMFRWMDLLPIECPVKSLGHNQPINSYTPSSPELSVPILCYYSLRKIGRIHIVWVDSLHDHCHFDSARKELRIFRFPALCVQAISGEPKLGILDRILRAHKCRNNCATELPDATEQYYKEVLLSYRLLFGRDKRSRKLFCRKESLRSSLDNLRDPVLHLLCGKKSLNALKNAINLDEFYEGHNPVCANFPTLGNQLLQLQDYNAKQNPQGWRAIFSDKRDPEKSFQIFWTVIVIGGLSVALSFVQTVAVIAQLAISKA